jgi:hypothetical protein
VFVCLFEAEVFVNWRVFSRLSQLMTEILAFHANFVDFIGRIQKRAAAVRGARDLTPPGTDDRRRPAAGGGRGGEFSDFGTVGLVRRKQKQDRPPRFI